MCKNALKGVVVVEGNKLERGGSREAKPNFGLVDGAHDVSVVVVPQGPTSAGESDSEPESQSLRHKGSGGRALRLGAVGPASLPQGEAAPQPALAQAGLAQRAGEATGAHVGRVAGL